MSRELTGHKVNQCNEALTVRALTPPHSYEICFTGRDGGVRHNFINFQNGPIKEAGINGLTREALLEIVIDSLEHFQKTDWQCAENAVAIDHLRAAQAALRLRTMRRLKEGVEGTHQK